MTELHSNKPSPSRCDENLSAKGEQRRLSLIEAAMRLIVRDGHHSLSLRSVAKEAGCSHGSVAYYFGSKGALMSAAIDHACEKIAISFSEIAPDLEACAHDPARFATLIAQYNTRLLIEDRSMGIAVYELNLAGAHDPSLRPALSKWGRIHADLCREAFLKLGSQDPGADFAFVLHAIGGLVIAQLSLPRKDFEHRIFLPAIERLVFSVAGLAPRAAQAKS
ncbi:TetR family transcriptional regulator [Pseudomonas sp. PA-7-1E]|jgi:AcrR family transcriptional regulator|uniref:TetR family transcriptional regulator n=2 Tax=Pseudomonas carnis TaxID=2487355 RepID=A0ABT5RMN2_9PSED|nr:MULTISPECIES: TetR/AcrR family transcriptional regulator [Pseudomonas]MBA1252339.1 TetR family transcriptional regulator [Pseudomonas carnis]MBA1270098.1 TetR family transcriptional regulator [Pseudomonas carnis]MBA1301555.1 TetR family transcriptional regulator [Pseudomonas carnis]MBJ2203506.1 TetR family transcriptional regulator [Pseudomonas carnis]MBJ2280573.1 TetR family transcriptional regulator [Pseudomonas sp. MF6767]